MSDPLCIIGTKSEVDLLVSYAKNLGVNYNAHIIDRYDRSIVSVIKKSESFIQRFEVDDVGLIDSKVHAVNL